MSPNFLNICVCRELRLKRRYVELAEWLAAFNVERVVPATPCALLGRVALYRQLLLLHVGRQDR